MPFHNINGSLNHYKARQLDNSWESISKIKETLALTESDISNLFKLTEKEFKKLRHESRSLPISSAMAFCDSLNISLEALIVGNIDLPTLAHYFSKKEAILPERYSIGAYGKRRSIINILDYIAMKYGWKKRSLILRNFQMQEQIFANPEQTINNRFIVDLCTYLKTLGHTNNELFEMGAYSIKSNKNNKLGKILSPLRSSKDILQHIIDLKYIYYYDQNFDYRFSKNDYNGCVIEIRQNQKVVEALKVKKLGSPELCITKSGVFSTMSCYAGFLPAKVIETRCIHRGDSYCRLEISYDNRSVTQ